VFVTPIGKEVIQMASKDRAYWEALYNEGLILPHWPANVFAYLLDKIFGPSGQSIPSNPITVDEDVLMTFLVTTDSPATPSEPRLGPGP
jgi:hypothetical protein